MWDPMGGGVPTHIVGKRSPKRLPGPTKGFQKKSNSIALNNSNTQRIYLVHQTSQKGGKHTNGA